jgi:quinol-cytochrome oxidoreductase complex cytochrome b subunit
MLNSIKPSKFLLNSVPESFSRLVLLTLNSLKLLLPLNVSRWNKNYLLALADSHLIHYSAPITLTYAWSFGALAGICLVIQMLSGIFLAMHYTPHIDLAFSSVEHIMRDVNNGWLIRYIHANGASMFFIVVYSHICRGLYYGSYMAPRELLWCSGVIIFLLMMGTAFTGYVLPWGQMSFWGATVITSMVTAIPVAGQPIVQWLWGGYTVSNPTLNRFFSIHFVLPFVIAGLTLIHLILLHKEGSNSPLGSDSGVDDIPFYPYYVSKDVFALFCFFAFFGTFVFYFPNVLNHPDNYIPADPLQTPAHVVPEWYFLPYYAILRSIPHKAGGIIAMIGAILVLLLIPFTNTSDVRNSTYRPIFKFFFWLFIVDFIILTWVGQKPVRDTFILVGQIATVYYFAFFIILIPIIGRIESMLIHYKSNN